jgi:hypothetical protein
MLSVVGFGHSNGNGVMKQILLILGTAALAASTSASAKPGGGFGGPHGMNVGGPHGNPHSMGIGFAGRPSGPVGVGVGGCPPGLAKKAVPCVPPGLAKHQFAIGQRIPTGLGLLSFNALPRSVRTRHVSTLNRRSRFLMTNGSIVSVNPRTRIVQSVIPMH